MYLVYSCCYIDKISHARLQQVYNTPDGVLQITVIRSHPPRYLEEKNPDPRRGIRTCRTQNRGIYQKKLGTGGPCRDTHPPAQARRSKEGLPVHHGTQINEAILVSRKSHPAVKQRPRRETRENRHENPSRRAENSKRCKYTQAERIREQRAEDKVSSPS